VRRDFHPPVKSQMLYGFIGGIGAARRRRLLREFNRRAAWAAQARTTPPLGRTVSNAER
jgi:hypothetical protein